MQNESTFPFQRLDAYKLARELARAVHEAKISDAELRDQATRAAKSCFLNLCEGLPSRSAPMRRRFFAASNGSLHEAVGAVDLALAIAAIDEPIARQALATGHRLYLILGALLR